MVGRAGDGVDRADGVRERTRDRGGEFAAAPRGGVHRQHAVAAGRFAEEFHLADEVRVRGAALALREAEGGCADGHVWRAVRWREVGAVVVGA